MNYEQATQQIARIGTAVWQTQQLEQEAYVHLSWEDWAYLVTTLGHQPKVVACGEQGYTVVRDGLTQPHDSFYCLSACTGARLFYNRKECWYSAHLKAE